MKRVVIVAAVCLTLAACGHPSGAKIVKSKQVIPEGYSVCYQITYKQGSQLYSECVTRDAFYKIQIGQDLSK